MARPLTARGRCLRHLSTHRLIGEQPPGSNTDTRPNPADPRWGIRRAQEHFGAWLVGLAWCGTWAGWALDRAGVRGVTSRIASVALIEADARAGRRPFRRWTHQRRLVLRGDLAVMFGHGVHVETVRSFVRVRGVGWCCRTEAGNTSLPGNPGGSQSAGGISTPRLRRLSDVYGYALVDFPGGPAARAIDMALTIAGTRVVLRRGAVDLAEPASSDESLLAQLRARAHGSVRCLAALELLGEIEQAIE
jgi:hypothetical protein